MTTNESLILGMTPREERWEDQEKANYDVESLTREFRTRLYGSGLLLDPHNPFMEEQQ